MAFIDVGLGLTELLDVVDIVYWPAVIDAKEEDLKNVESLDVALFFGAVRMDKHRETAELLREKADVFVSFGTCACFGGTLGLANASEKQEILQTGYLSAKSTDNPDLVLPGKGSREGDEFPELEQKLQPVGHIVDVDVVVPGCPPPVDSVVKLIAALKDYRQGKLTGKLTIAEDVSLCDVCDREKPDEIRLEDIVRIHQTKIDENECFLKQGILCMGPVTRAGCGESCIKGNMPCRGCFGPVPEVDDQGTKFLTTIATAYRAGEEGEIGEDDLKKLIDNIKDPMGTFYRYSLASSIISRRYSDIRGE